MSDKPEPLTREEVITVITLLHKQFKFSNQNPNAKFLSDTNSYCAMACGLAMDAIYTENTGKKIEV